MDEQSRADCFSREVDSLLNREGRTDAKPMSGEYSQALDMAFTLSRTDYSHESRVRQTLRRQLLTQISQSGLANPRKKAMAPQMPYPAHLRRGLLTAVGGAFALLLVLMLLYPAGPSVAAQGVEDSAKVIVLGSYSMAQKAEAWAVGKPAPSDEWSIVLPGIAIGGNGISGSNPVVRTVPTLKEAQALAAFSIRTPAYLPKGYALREIKLAPIWTGPAELLLPAYPGVFLFFSGPGSDIVIAEQPVGPQATRDPTVSVGAMTGFQTTGTLDQVEINGHVAAWAKDHALLWQAGNISYMIVSANLTLEYATRIAESLN